MPFKLSRTQTVAIAIGAAYGIFIRIVSNPPSFLHLPSGAAWNDGSQVMTLGFLVFVPVIMGWLTISESATDGRYLWVNWIFLPWITILLADLGMFLAFIEGFICIVFAIPITLFFSSIGGVVAGLTLRSRFLRSRTTTVCLAMLPLLISIGEVRHQTPLDLRTVHNAIVIHAPANTVWDNIKRVPAIQRSEIRDTWAHRIGFPLPVEATLDKEAVGGVRHASFERGLVFIETVTRWEPNQDIAFTIVADTAGIPATTLDEHVTIGGRYFDVLNGEYRLEPLPDGSILLHLTSHQRLNTDFNVYAHLWTDAVMSDLQQSILEVVKHRCEQHPIDFIRSG